MMVLDWRFLCEQRPCCVLPVGRKNTFGERIVDHGEQLVQEGWWKELEKLVWNPVWAACSGSRSWWLPFRDYCAGSDATNSP